MNSVLYLLVWEKPVTAYRVQLLPLSETGGVRVIRLWKDDEISYDVYQDMTGAHCGCWGGLSRENAPVGCRHVEALKQQGLL